MSKDPCSLEEIDRRITFHEPDEIMEVSFQNLSIDNSAEANAIYDRIEQRIAETGERQWFFLVNYGETRIDSSAWFAFSRRGKELNLAHSMGSVRFDPSDVTRKQIERAAGTENFDPNLFTDRDRAIAHLRAQPSMRRKRVERVPSFTRGDLEGRIVFRPDDEIMDVDFSDMSFEHSRDVNDVYDFIDAQIAESGRKWYFLVNYENTRIQSPAWVQYAARGKALNETWSLGSVRYAPDSETETDIRLRAENGGFRPNIRNTRDEAIERIDEMKAEVRATGRATGNG